MNKSTTLLLSIAMLLFAFLSVNAKEVSAQKAKIIGHVTEEKSGEVVPYATVVVKGTTLGVVTDDEGRYEIENVPNGTFTIKVSSVGYSSSERRVLVEFGKTVEADFTLAEESIALDAVVVTANRNETAHRLAPTLVNVLTPKVFETTNGCTLSQGLVFQPGVRVENDCQNCGYTQVRINGLDGKYTQILVDSRPIFSSLAGVYGLEQIPANMIERVEVVRGGGSALYGSSAIAGTINVITREPVRNTGSIAHTISNYDGSGSFDNNTTLNLSLVSNDSRFGAYVYGQNRERSSWDQNGDGFTELPKLKNHTIGLNGYFRISPFTKLGVEYHHLEEFRRGGSRLDLPPHIAENSALNGMGEDGLVEQIEHSINSGGLKFIGYSKDNIHTFNAYASAQDIKRKTYYSAYGTTSDFTGVLGAQHIFHFNNCLFMPADFTWGIELHHDNLKDRAIDYQKYHDLAVADHPDAEGEELEQLVALYTPKPLDQTINTHSAYVQNEWKNDRWSLLLGGRLDKSSALSHAIFSPRANVRYNPTPDVNIRLSYAEGFRAPQAFDEDLHIGTIGGELVWVERADDLKEERSRSVNVSVDWYKTFGSLQFNVLAEGFFTALSDPFVLSAPNADPNGTNYLIQTRYNGSGSKVYGSTLECKLAYLKKAQLQAGITAQRSRYDEMEEWSSDEEHLSLDERSTRNILRTPDFYGYFTATYNPIHSVSVSLNGNYTGAMYVPHLWSEVNGSADELVHSDRFMELGAKATYDFDFANLCLQFNVGVQNIFNSYQKDFDKGANRDSGYIYGPASPRTFFAGMKVSF